MHITARSFASAYAHGGDWETLTRRCLDDLRDVPAGANLGFLYMTDPLDEDCQQILEALRRGTGIEDWVGTIGFGVCVSGQEFFDTPAMTVLVAAIPEDSYRILPTISKPGEDLPADILDWVGRRQPLLGIVHGDPRNAYLSGIIDSIADDTDCFLVGGLTASRGRMHQVAGRLTEGGVSGVLFADDVVVSSGLTQGCSPIGGIHEVTKAEENVVLELDGRPALEVFKDDIGEILARNLNRVAGYIHAALPISGSDTGDYLVRNIMGIDPKNGWIAIGERLGKGDKVMFVRRDGGSAMTDLQRMVSDVSDRAGDAPKAGLYFSCVARGPNMFGGDSEELSVIKDKIGDIPMIGFFANGEISSNRLYGYSGVLTLIL